MYHRSVKSQLAILTVLSFLVTFISSTGLAQQSNTKSPGATYHISALKSDFTADSLSVKIKGTSIPAYTVSERFAPFRVIVDIADVELSPRILKNKPLIPNNAIGSLSLSKLEGNNPEITRFELTLPDTHDYSVKRDGTDLEIVIAPASPLVGSKNTDYSSTPAITDFKITTEPGQTSILLASTSALKDFKIAKLNGGDSKPARMFIDVPDVSISELVREKEIGTSIDKVRVAPRGSGARIVFDSSSNELFDYNVVNTAEGLKVVVKENETPLMNRMVNVASPAQNGTSDSTLDELIESSSDLLSKSQSAATGEEVVSDSVSSLQDSFAFSGYNKKRISVDFYKIDIHNVFRLFRQITDLNIIVSEGVQGTVTLALNDVPWDFALDIILNLQNLEKEERYNTIVIYPKKKEFAWPERAEDNLSFEADVEVVEQEALIIEQSANVPKEIMQAKEILQKARAAEKKENYENAVALYEQASKLWKDNTSIYNRLASIYLVHLGMNAKAVFFAKKGLEVDPSNSRAALFAAIASANMQRIADASEFFTQSISGNPPMKEALFSFATFNETNKQYLAAIKLLDKYHQYYGETPDTMLAKARIYDKMGQTEKATEQYRAIMASGFQLRPDLRKYILGRLAIGNN